MCSQDGQKIHNYTEKFADFLHVPMVDDTQIGTVSYASFFRYILSMSLMIKE